MYNVIGDVPAVIRSFYREEVRNEQVFNEDGTPKMVDTPYKYKDEDGDNRTGIRPEPVFEDNTYVVEKSQDECKKIDDVWRVAKLHRGSRDDIIKLFLGMVDNCHQYGWFTKYNKWLDDCELVNEANANKKPDDEGVMPDDLPFPVEPVKPAAIDYDQWVIANHVLLRTCAMPNKSDQMIMLSSDLANGTTTFQDRMKAIAAQYPDS